MAIRLVGVTEKRMRLSLFSRFAWLLFITLVMAIVLPSRVDLQMTFLRLTKRCQKCSLSYVKLQNINLNHADLRQADLRGAIFTNVDLSYADLRGANLRNARFNGVTLTKTRLCGAVLPDPKNPTLVLGDFGCD